MSEIVIKVNGLSKQYKLGQIGTGSISDDLSRWWSRVRGKEDPFLKIGEENDRTITGSSDYVWALKDINFNVHQGDVLGIIGRNGAGKSTLLKIVSRTTSPSKGTVGIKGRIASLLEVGTGFHPELSGRENIFLNGAILGMTKKEITRKFDEIVDFSGVERYIETPVKRYSSGMYVRLAFAVAAHLESEILIVDEVLAVGDSEFQKKCLGKMGEVSRGEGRTVLFVSHNMGAVAALCSSAIFLSRGKVELSGHTKNVIDYYLEQGISTEREYIAKSLEKNVSVAKVHLANSSNEKTTVFTHDQEIKIVANLSVVKWPEHTEFRVVLRDLHGKAIFTSDLKLDRCNTVEILAIIPYHFLRPGTYTLTVATFIPHKEIFDLLEDVLPITVVDGGSKYAASDGLDYGYIFFEPKWETTYR